MTRMYGVRPFIYQSVLAAAVIALMGAGAPIRAQDAPPLSATESPRYRIREVRLFGETKEARATGISPRGDVIGQAGFVSWEQKPHAWNPPFFNPLTPQSYFNPDFPNINRTVITPFVGGAGISPWWTPTAENMYIGGIMGIAIQMLIDPQFAAAVWNWEDRRIGIQAPNERITVAGFSQVGGRAVPFSAFGGSGGIANDINAAGIVVGAASTSPYDKEWRRAFVYRPGDQRVSFSSHGIRVRDTGRMIDLGTLGGRDSTAYGINDTGHVVGESDMGYGITRAFFWSDGSMRNLGTLGGARSFARDVNNKGQVVGWAEDKEFANRAFLYENGAMRMLESPEGASATYAVAINEDGYSVGRVEFPDGVIIAALWDTRGRALPLGTLNGPTSEANAINGWMQIVGTSRRLVGGSRAFLYQNRKMIDLNDCLPANSGWVLLSATGINDKGEIVGWGRKDGKIRAFTLTPEVVPPAEISAN
jgi:probable HAF family extracellular repeat protein